ncbi:YdcH family protein [Sphingomonas sp.]|uniref:YdcH family protein n=1 Tax=Sphingomonas sp. TaxID=28214 RepID=UPI003D6D75EA
MTVIVTRLIAAHRALNQEIAREVARRMPDGFRLATLKKRRLAIKDNLHRQLAAARRATRGRSPAAI